MSFSTGYWSVEHPDVVEAVHRDYLDAGCELILTNTFKNQLFPRLRSMISRELCVIANTYHEDYNTSGY